MSRLLNLLDPFQLLSRPSAGTDDELMTSVFLAVRRGSFTLLKDFMRQYPVRLKFGTKLDENDFTIAHVAAFSRQWQILSWCVTECPQVCYLRDANRQTVMLWAVGNGCPAELMQFMLSNKGDLNTSTATGISILQCAAATDRSPGAQTVQLLLQHDKVDINKRENEGLSAIFFAIRNDNLPALKTLCSHPRIDLQTQDHKKRSVLHHCVQGTNEKDRERPLILFHLLSQTICDITLVNAKGQTALDVSMGNTLSRLLLLAADLGRNPQPHRAEKVDEFKHLLLRFPKLNKRDNGSPIIDPMAVFDFLHKEGVQGYVQDEIGFLEQNSSLEQEPNAALPSQQHSQILQMPKKSSNDPVLVDWKLDREGRSFLWHLVKQQNKEKLQAIFKQISDDAYKSGIISYRILQGNPSPLFLAVETNQCDTLDILLQMVGSCPKESLVSPQLTSDGMSVLDVAASKGYKTALEKLIRSGIFTRSETIKACKDYGHYALMRKYLASPLYLLTQRFPMFDDKCVENSPVKKGFLGATADLRKVDDFKVGDICWPRIKGQVDNFIVHTWMITERHLSCKCDTERKKRNCMMVFDLIRTAKVMENFLNSSNSPLAILKPRLKVAGSIVEGTRLGQPDELDITVEFKELSPNNIEFGDTALSLKITGKSQELMKRWITSNNCLDMTQFLKSILETLQDCLRISDVHLPSSVSLLETQIEWLPCQSCTQRHHGNQENSNIENTPPWSHCDKCIQSIAISKSGPCVVFHLLQQLVSIDIIPVFPSPESNPVKLFELVVQTLKKERPANWKGYLSSFVKKDRILPEELEILGQTPNPKICVKILNFDPESNNFILRPGQPLLIRELRHERRKDVYCSMKALKSHFGANVSSYNLKRVLLLPGHRELVEDETIDKMEVLFHLMEYPMIKEQFKSLIDYDGWKAMIEEAKLSPDRRHYIVPAHEKTLIPKM